MKKFTITLFVCAFFLSLTHAQFGIRAGVNSSDLSLKLSGQSFDTDSKVGFHIGGVYDIAIGNNGVIRPAILFSTKGTKVPLIGDNLNMSYLDIPVTYVHKFGDEEKGFFLNGGLYLGILLSAKTGDTDSKDDFTTTDLGLNLGLGYKINSSISVGLDFSNGLTDISAGAGSDDVTSKVTNASLYAIYHL